jgi:Curli production assembly/transport component CsgG
LVDTNTLEVVDVISYQKQIIGRQISAGVFDFLGANFFDASVGEAALEPIQLAVRSVIERAVLEMTSRLYQTGAGCARALGTSADPLADATDRVPDRHDDASTQTLTATNEEKHNDNARQDPYHGYSSDDPASEPSLRGGVE